MKLIYYSPHPTHDIVTEVGYATHQRETIEALREIGVQVVPLIMGGTERSELKYSEGKALEHKGFKALLKKLIPRFIWVSLKDFKLLMFDQKASQKLNDYIIKHSPDIVYERSEYLQDASVKVVKNFKVKYFVEVNSPFVEEMISMEGKSIWTKLAHKKEKNKYQNADKIFVVSSVLKDFLISKYQINSTKIIVSPNRINSEKFTKNKDIRIDLSFSKEELIVGFVGSILPHHYVEDLIDAFDIIQKRYSHVKLLIVGGGTLLQRLKFYSKYLKISDKIIFTGKIEHKNIPAFINKMDICVMPGSNWYGSPIKIFEYGILGKVIIAPNNGPVKDIMENLKDGLLIEKGPNEIAKAIELLIEKPELKYYLAENFRNKITENYTWIKAAELIISSSKY